MLLAVVGATLLSTLAMVLYPVLVQAVGFTSYRAGMFLGSTIHDVVQDSAPLDTATAVKLFRVMLLMPVVLGVALVLHGQAACGAPAGHTADVG